MKKRVIMRKKKCVDSEKEEVYKTRWNLERGREQMVEMIGVIIECLLRLDQESMITQLKMT